MEPMERSYFDFMLEALLCPPLRMHGAVLLCLKLAVHKYSDWFKCKCNFSHFLKHVTNLFRSIYLSRQYLSGYSECFHFSVRKKKSVKLGHELQCRLYYFTWKNTWSLKTVLLRKKKCSAQIEVC